MKIAEDSTFETYYRNIYLPYVSDLYFDFFDADVNFLSSYNILKEVSLSSEI